MILRHLSTPSPQLCLEPITPHPRPPPSPASTLPWCTAPSPSTHRSKQRHCPTQSCPASKDPFLPKPLSFPALQAGSWPTWHSPVNLLLSLANYSKYFRRAHTHTTRPAGWGLTELRNRPILFPKLAEEAAQPPSEDNSPPPAVAPSLSPPPTSLPPHCSPALGERGDSRLSTGPQDQPPAPAKGGTAWIDRGGLLLSPLLTLCLGPSWGKWGKVRVQVRKG